MNQIEQQEWECTFSEDAQGKILERKQKHIQLRCVAGKICCNRTLSASFYGPLDQRSKVASPSTLSKAEAAFVCLNKYQKVIQRCQGP